MSYQWSGILILCALGAVLPQLARAASFTIEDGALRPIYAPMLLGTSTTTTTKPLLYQASSVPSGSPDLILLMRDGLTSDNDLPQDISVDEVRTHNDLDAFARAQMRIDTRIADLALSSSSLGLTYLMPTKMFGGVEVMMPLRAEVRSDGSVSVRSPWYGGLLLFNTNQITARVERAARAVLAAATPQPDGQIALPPVLQAKLLATIYAALQGEDVGLAPSHTQTAAVPGGALASAQ